MNSFKFIEYTNEHESKFFIIDVTNNKFYEFCDNEATISEINENPLDTYQSCDSSDDEYEYCIITDNYNDLSLDREELNKISWFINDKLDMELGDSKDQMYKTWWNEYKSLCGQLIERYEDYVYFAELMFLLTRGKISEAPIQSNDGFTHFFTILTDTYKKGNLTSEVKQVNYKREYDKFFKSIDNITPYS